MRVLQCDSFYRIYLDQFYCQWADLSGARYHEIYRGLLEGHNCGVHILQPVQDMESGQRLVVLNDRVSQAQWAEERQLRVRDAGDILLAQAEEYQSEVLYVNDVSQVDHRTLSHLPSCVKSKVLWHAGPWHDYNFEAYDLCLSNYPPYVERWRASGLRAAYFSPSHDPVMAQAVAGGVRPIDVAFAGSLSGHHKRRKALLEVVSTVLKDAHLHFALLAPRWRPLMDRGPLRRISLPIPYLPPDLNAVCHAPVFGRQLYDLFGRAKIVLNVTPEISDQHRVNMRVFEAMGCGACMLGELGVYPPGLEEGQDFVGFEDGEEVVPLIAELLANPQRTAQIGAHGARKVASLYSKEDQWKRFCGLVAA